MMNDMLTVHEAAELSGLTVRTLQYYDRIGLLPPSAVTDAGYRLYDGDAMKKLQQIMLFRELEFPLKEIAHIMNDESFDGDKALDQQIELLRLRREHLDGLIRFAESIRDKGVEHIMSRSGFSAFDRSKMEEYARRAREQWGNTAEYRECSEKEQSRTDDGNALIAQQMMEHFVRFGQMKERDPADSEVSALVAELQSFICENYYNCTNEMLMGLGEMYEAAGEFRENIDSAGGKGTAEFVHRAIQSYCRSKK